MRTIVGAAGFEPTASSTRTMRATGLRYAPNDAKNTFDTLRLSTSAYNHASK